MIPLFRVHMPPKAELMPALERVLYSGQVGQGPEVDEFENQVGRYLGWPNVVTVNSGTSAIQLALRLAGVSAGSVVTTPMTCAATNMPILAERARPIWADIDPATGNIDPADVERKIHSDTRAILAVHWGGQPADVDALREIGAWHGIPVIEDAAHALGATWGGRPVGAGTADYTCFSLQAIKHITTVDGGLLTTYRPGMAKLARVLRWYGLDRDQPFTDARVDVDAPAYGHKWHMNDVTATIGLAQLPHLPAIVEAQRANAAWYTGALAAWTDVAEELPKARGAWWLYTVLLADARERDAFMTHMRAAGVAVSRVHRRNDTLTCFRPYSNGPLPGVDEFTARMCCLPVHSALTPADREQVASAVVEFCERARAVV